MIPQGGLPDGAYRVGQYPSVPEVASAIDHRATDDDLERTCRRALLNLQDKICDLKEHVLSLETEDEEDKAEDEAQYQESIDLLKQGFEVGLQECEEGMIEKDKLETKANMVEIRKCAAAIFENARSSFRERT